MIKEETRNAYIGSVNRALDYINAHYADTIDLATLAGEGCFSPFHFHQIFKAIVGETHHRYLNRLRLEKSVLMMDEGQSLTGIALASGFSTPAHFAQAFRKQYGMTPRSYRLRRLERRLSLRKDLGPAPSQSGPGLVARSAEYTVKHYPSYRIAYVRHIGGYNAGIGFAWRKLMKWARSNKVLSADTLRISCSYDDPELTPDGRLRYDACVTVPEGIEAEGPVGIRTIAGGTFAVFTFRGPTRDLPAFYDRVYGVELPANGRRLADAPGFRVHLETPLEQILGKFHNELRIPLL